MSPEYKIEIVLPYTFVVEADNVIEAEEKAWDIFSSRKDYDVPKPVMVEIEEISSPEKMIRERWAVKEDMTGSKTAETTQHGGDKP